MIVVIGAGPAGLSVAHHLADVDHLVLERESGAGGLCRSFTTAGATFDLGGHAFFTRHDVVRDLIRRTGGSALFTQPRSAWVRSHGVFVKYPFQTHLHGLPLDVVEECLTGLFEAARAPGGRDASTMPEWIESTFGAGIAKHFMTPYNTKLWGYPLEELSASRTSGRIVTPDVGAVVRGALRAAEFSDFPNAVVGYPANGGFFGLFAGMARGEGERLRLDTVVIEVDARRHRVLTAPAGGGEQRWIDYEHLVSTMPLDQLVRMTSGLDRCCHEAAAVLRHTSLYLVNLVVERRNLTPMQRVYSADPAVPFHKLVINANSSPSLREQPRHGVQAEVSWTPHRPVDSGRLVTDVREALHDMGLLGRGDEIVETSTVQVPYAYPVAVFGTEEARQHVLTALQRHDIAGTGRFGEWLYINSDDAVMRGRARAEALRGAA